MLAFPRVWVAAAIFAAGCAFEGLPLPNHAPGPLDPRAAAFDSAAVVFQGRVRWINFGIDAELVERSYGFSALHVWKGNVPDTLRLNSKETVGPCPRHRYRLSAEYIIYAALDTGGIYTTRCSRIIPVGSDSAQAEMAFLRRFSARRR